MTDKSSIWKNETGWHRKCPKCGVDITHNTKHAKYIVVQSNRLNKECRSCSNSARNSGRKFSTEHKNKLSLAAQKERKKRYSVSANRLKMSESTKLAMRRPDVRKKHLEALHRSKWIKVRTDKGQLELLEKWNRLGFRFEPNYQVKTDLDLFYIDGYDVERNVVLEYDTKYHNKPYQKKKDLVRQQKIIQILQPKKFWRYIHPQNKFVEITGDTQHGK